MSPRTEQELLDATIDLPSRPVVSSGVCVVPDEAVEAAAKALVMSQTNGCCDEWPKPCADCDCFRASHPALTAGYDRAHAHAALAAALPVLRAAGDQAEFHVPQIVERRGGDYGVICAACSAAAGDYVHECRRGGGIPQVVLRAADGWAERERQLREIAELYLYDGDTDQPINDGYHRLLDLADEIKGETR